MNSIPIKRHAVKLLICGENCLLNFALLLSLFLGESSYQSNTVIENQRRRILWMS